MPVFDAGVARCDVFTYKEGLLSAVGHDVKLTVGKFSITAEDGRIKGTFDPSSLTVVSAMKDGVENRGALSEKDRKTIEGYVKEDVLHARRYPRIVFSTSQIEPDDDDGWTFEGQLELHGRTRSVRGRATGSGDAWVSRVSLHQPDFGITPFSAMFGTLRIQPRVDVEIRVPRAAISPSDDASAPR